MLDPVDSIEVSDLLPSSIFASRAFAFAFFSSLPKAASGRSRMCSLRDQAILTNKVE